MNTPDPNQAPQRLLAGAVDLSALAQSAPPAPSQAPPGGGPAAGGVAVIDVTDATVESEVLQRSLNLPVVVVFWTEQSPPSVQMADMFAKLAMEADGAWTLAKADVAHNQQLAMALQLQSVPAVAAVLQGRIVDLQQGVVQEKLARQWVGQLIAAAGGEPPEEPVDPKLAEADQALELGNYDAAEAAYSKYLAENPGNGEAEAGLAQVRLLRRVGEADVAAALAKAGEDPDDIPSALLAADAEVISGRAEAAYDRLIGLVRRTAGDDRDTVRKHLLELFLVAAPDDPTVTQARKRLAAVLF